LEFKEFQLGDLVKYNNDKISVFEVKKENYISTENMLPDKKGIGDNAKLPEKGKVNVYVHGDILISNIRPYFKKIWFADNIGSHSTDVLNLRITSKEVLSKYLYYYVLQDRFFEYMTTSSKGTKMPRGDKQAIMKYPVFIPDISMQSKIVSILSNLDDKIQNNLYIIDNLEQISQTLFKRWFIDFEFPNEEGQPYKSSGGKMIESELGEIPEGWEVKKLKDLTLQYKDTFNPKKSEEEEVYHYSLPAYDANSYPVVDKVKEIKSNKWIVEDNCVVFSKMNPKTPRVWLIKEKDDLLNVASSEFVVLKNKSEKSNFFIYNVCNNQKFTEYLCSNTTGSTNSRQRVTPTIALDFKLAVNEQIISKFSNLISANGKMILEAAEENKNLEQLRDTLLPKLLSGEIEIPDDLEV